MLLKKEKLELRKDNKEEKNMAERKSEQLIERCDILKKQLMLIGNNLSTIIEGQYKWSAFQKFQATKLVYQLSDADVVQVVENGIVPKKFQLQITPTQFGISISKSGSDVEMEKQVEEIIEKLNSISPIIKFEYTGLDIKELRNSSPIIFYIKWRNNR